MGGLALYVLNDCFSSSSTMATYTKQAQWQNTRKHDFFPSSKNLERQTLRENDYQLALFKGPTKKLDSWMPGGRLSSPII